MKIIDVQKVYEDDENLRKEDVAILQEWIQKQPHLPPVSELDLALFLHSCFYSIELAKTTIDNFYTYRTHSPDFFTKCSTKNEPTVQTAMNTVLYVDLPKLTPEGYKIFFCKLMDKDVHNYHFAEHAKMFDMCATQWLHEDGPAKGLMIILDIKDFSMGHIMKMNVVLMKKFLMYLQEAVPVRLKSIHFINGKAIMDTLMTLMKPFLKKEVAETFYSYDTNYEKLYNFVPKECLPKDYGGAIDSTTVLHEQMKKRFIENADFFEQKEKYIADESKRLGKPKSENDVFGVEGTFKKLGID